MAGPPRSKATNPFVPGNAACAGVASPDSANVAAEPSAMSLSRVPIWKVCMEPGSRRRRRLASWEPPRALGLLALESGGDLGAGADVELAIRVGQVSLDGSHPHEQRLCDLTIGRPIGGQLCHPQLTRGERIAATDVVATRAGAGRAQLLARASRQRVRATAHGEVEGLPERLL